MILDHKLLTRTSTPLGGMASGSATLHSLLVPPSPDGAVRCSVGMHVCVAGAPETTLQMLHLPADVETSAPSSFEDKASAEATCKTIVQAKQLGTWTRPTHRVIHPLTIYGMSVRSGWRLRGNTLTLDVEVLSVCKDGLVRVLSTDATRAMNSEEKDAFMKLKAEVASKTT